MTELREAIGMLSSADASLAARSIPWRQAVEKLCSPLIEMQPDLEYPEDCSCLLFHSKLIPGTFGSLKLIVSQVTVKTFLYENPDILSQERSSEHIHPISEASISNACIRYLRQQRYGQILVKAGGKWTTGSGEKVKDHHFLTYSAKYWNRHLDEVEGSPELYQEIENFIKSANFVTNLQIQSLFVEGQFSIYTLHGCSTQHKYIKRVFPRWFVSQNRIVCRNYWSSYCTFIAEWNRLLHLPTCDDRHCRSVGYQGELDRCLFGALGPQNFLSHIQGRYTSFALAGRDGPRFENNAFYCESIMGDGSEVIVLHLTHER